MPDKQACSYFNRCYMIFHMFSKVGKRDHTQCISKVIAKHVFAYVWSVWWTLYVILYVQLMFWCMNEYPVPNWYQQKMVFNLKLFNVITLLQMNPHITYMLESQIYYYFSYPTNWITPRDMKSVLKLSYKVRSCL